MFGSHLSIAGGMHNDLLEAERLHFDTVLVVTKNYIEVMVQGLKIQAASILD